MPFPTISIVNFSNLQDHDVQVAIRAINRQIREDFAPIWGAVWNLRLHGSRFDADDIDSLAEEFVQGEAVLYIVDEGHLPGAAGYHSMNGREMPFGFVFLTNLNEWTVTLSHEALELIIDPTVNVMVPGPDPRPGRQNNIVLHAYEVCDAVERTSYSIDEVRVSNFITQQWFSPDEAPGTRNDFLGVEVRSFNATENSHLAFFDLSGGGWVTYYGPATGELPPVISARQEYAGHDRKRLDPEKEPQMIEVLQSLQSKPPFKVKGAAARRRLNQLVAVTRGGRRQHARTQISPNSE